MTDNTIPKESKKHPIMGFVIILGIIAILVLLVFIFRGQQSNIQSSSQGQPQSLLGNQNVNSNINGITVPALAVNTATDTGSVQYLTVSIIPGDGSILMNTNPYLDLDLQYSTNLAASVAENISHINPSNKDLIYSYKPSDKVEVMSGGSAGAAETIATIAVLEGKSIKPDVAVTGVINPDGSIGPVGGILEKAKAAADAGYKLLLIPQGQSVINNYDLAGIDQRMRPYYNVTSTNVTAQAKSWGLEVKEVSNMQDVARYMLV